MILKAARIVTYSESDKGDEESPEGENGTEDTAGRVGEDSGAQGEE